MDSAISIQVFLRIKPVPTEERICLDTSPTEPNTIRFFGLGGDHIFQYDGVGGPSCPQEAVFGAVAQAMTDHYISGYNATIFAYGQTGSGKTFTMQGQDDQVGLIQRCLYYLFDRLEEERNQWNETIVKGTFVEIYNETVYDLLNEHSFSQDDAGNVRVLREDVKRGVVYIEGAKEERLVSAESAINVFKRGANNRHVAETRMNRESSRSHSIFTIYLTRRRKVNAIEETVESRFNLVDLAGSERQQSTGTVGVRLKEAGNINKSLLALANVINSLSDQDSQPTIQSSSQQSQNRHVQYRDSKLTFLLRDSLGGNSRTAVVACVSPSWTCQGESLSTLRFARRAKMIKNKAMVNQDIYGSAEDMQVEIKRLQGLLDQRQHEPHIDGPLNVFVGKVLRKCREMEHQSELLKRRLTDFEDLLRRREQQLNSERLIVKLRDSALAAVKAQLPVDYLQAMEEVALLRRQLDTNTDSTRLMLQIGDLQSQLQEAKLEKFIADREYVEGLESLLVNSADHQDNLPLQPISSVKVQSAAVETDDIVSFLHQQLAFHKEHSDQQKLMYEQQEQNLLFQLAQVKEQLIQLQEQLGRSAADHEMRRMEWQSQLNSSNDTIRLLEFKLATAQQDNEDLLHKLSVAKMPISERISQLQSENMRLRSELDRKTASTASRPSTAQTLSIKQKQENMELKAALESAKQQITLLSSMLSAK